MLNPRDQRIDAFWGVLDALQEAQSNAEIINFDDTTKVETPRFSDAAANLLIASGKLTLFGFSGEIAEGVRDDMRNLNRQVLTAALTGFRQRATMLADRLRQLEGNAETMLPDDEFLVDSINILEGRLDLESASRVVSEWLFDKQDEAIEVQAACFRVLVEAIDDALERQAEHLSLVAATPWIENTRASIDPSQPIHQSWWLTDEIDSILESQSSNFRWWQTIFLSQLILLESDETEVSRLTLASEETESALIADRHELAANREPDSFFVVRELRSDDEHAPVILRFELSSRFRGKSFRSIPPSATVQVSLEFQAEPEEEEQPDAKDSFSRTYRLRWGTFWIDLPVTGEKVGMDSRIRFLGFHSNLTWQQAKLAIDGNSRGPLFLRRVG